jgi:hypothetical protein
MSLYTKESTRQNMSYQKKAYEKNDPADCWNKHKILDVEGGKRMGVGIGMRMGMGMGMGIWEWGGEWGGG